MAASAGAKPAVSVVGVGAYTAVGLTAATAAVAVRASMAAFGQHPFVVDRSGKKMIVARAPGVAETSRGADRWLPTAVPAAQEAMAPLRERKVPPGRLSVLVALPPVRPGLTAEAHQKFRAA